MKPFISKTLPILAAFSVLAGLTGCAEEPSQEHFNTPSYTYLPQLYLKVAQVKVHDKSKGSSSLVTNTPYPIDSRAITMAEQRLKPRAGAGEANFTVENVEVTKNSRVYSATLKIQLQCENPDMNASSTMTAFVKDDVTRTNGASEAKTLNDLASKIMDDMNVEIEYQLRNKMPQWLTNAAGETLSADGRKVQKMSAQTLAPIGTPAEARAE